VPQVRVRSLDANLGGGWSAPMGFPLSSPSGSAPRHRSDAPTTAFLPTFFITFFSYAHHRPAPQSVRRYLDSAPSRTAPVSRDERISGKQTFHRFL